MKIFNNINRNPGFSFQPHKNRYFRSSLKNPFNSYEKDFSYYYERFYKNLDENAISEYFRLMIQLADPKLPPKVSNYTMMKTLADIGKIDNGEYLSYLMESKLKYSIKPNNALIKSNYWNDQYLNEIDEYLDIVCKEEDIFFNRKFEGSNSFNMYFRETTVYKVHKDILGWRRSWLEEDRLTSMPWIK
jgi:hypothetical protein